MQISLLKNQYYLLELRDGEVIYGAVTNCYLNSYAINDRIILINSIVAATFLGAVGMQRKDIIQDKIDIKCLKCNKEFSDGYVFCNSCYEATYAEMD